MPDTLIIPRSTYDRDATASLTKGLRETGYGINDAGNSDDSPHLALTAK